MSLKTFLKKKAKYIGKPYKSEEEKKAYRESYSKARVSALRAKASKEARTSVTSGGFFGGLKKMAKPRRPSRRAIKRAKGKRRAERQTVSGLLGTADGMFEGAMRANMPIGLYPELTRRKKRKRRR